MDAGRWNIAHNSGHARVASNRGDLFLLNLLQSVLIGLVLFPPEEINWTAMSTNGGTKKAKPIGVVV